MGMFDSVYVECPSCKGRIEYQSKADEWPQLNGYTLDDAPKHILIDVLNDPHKCMSCETWVVLFDPQFPVELPKPNPRVAIVCNPEGDTNKHPSGLEWWPDLEPFFLFPNAGATP